MQIFNARTSFERLQMDILGPFPSSVSGNRYFLVIVDCFTKWAEYFLLKNARASTIAEVFVNQVVSRHGVPLELHTDQGKNFKSRLFQELSWMLGSRKLGLLLFIHSLMNKWKDSRQYFSIFQSLLKKEIEELRPVDSDVPPCL